MTLTMAGETGGTREAELAEALTAVRARLTAAAEAAGRNSDEIELLPVTKFFPATDVSILHHLGCEDFGESREQEAVNKAAEVANSVGGAPIRWHMVGRIQRNKARSIAGWAYAAHSVDSVRVIEALRIVPLYPCKLGLQTSEGCAGVRSQRRNRHQPDELQTLAGLGRG
ncbi:MAG: hypothetical protein ACXWZI_13900, partial [Mycobacterium sp.]